MYLENIQSPADVKKLPVDALAVLADEMRTALLKKLSAHGGHFGPNLGFAEATVALHYVFNSPTDKIVYDVSHQTYCHKMLTGRKDAFLDPEKYDDVSGYSNPQESAHDFFTIGHTSTSVSLACGLAKARDLKGGTENIIAVIGDGSLSGGEALEGLDFASELHSNLIIVVNDNQMSIAENHGGLYENLKLLRDTDGKAECNLFKSFGLDYVFIKNGNNVAELLPAFASVKDCKRPTVVHICTQKGKGFLPAETDKESWHWCMPFDPETGKAKFTFTGEDYSEITAQYLLKKMEEDKTVVAIASGVPAVLGFNEARRKQAGSQFVDVGIAEETAVALASGIAANGGKPVYGTYSTFLQRTFDQLSQDLCVNNNPATILVFSASIYGMNDVTHLGIYDIPMISNIPNLVYLAPTTKEEYLAMLDWSVEQQEHPVVIRVPGAEVISDGKAAKTDYSDSNRFTVTESGSKTAILALGTFYPLGKRVAEKIKAETGVQSTLINPQFISGLDDELLCELAKTHDTVITLEDGILNGGFDEKVARFYGSTPVRVLNYGYKKEFLDRYNVEDVLRENRLTPEQIAEDVKNLK